MHTIIYITILLNCFFTAISDDYIAVIKNFNLTYNIPPSNFININDLTFILENSITNFNYSHNNIIYYEKNNIITSLPFEEIDPRSHSNFATDLPWGIDRIDQFSLPLDYNYTPFGHGNNSIIYMLDTGIYASHYQFKNRILKGFDTTGEGINDLNGHGTHTSSTAMGKTFGVANMASILPVKVLNKDGSGSYWGVIKGINFALQHMKKYKKCGVINMSLGGPISNIINVAVDNAFQNNLISVVAAGNSANDACLYSPASATSAVTVGATSNLDKLVSFSNFGKCVNILAPGNNILGAGISSKSSIRYASGTSMSSPHVAGIIATIMSKYGCSSPNKTLEILDNWAIKNAISLVPTTTPNKLSHLPNIHNNFTMRPTTFPTKFPTKKKKK